MVKRLFINCIYWPMRARSFISNEKREALKDAVENAEKGHKGEIVVVVEGGLPFADVLQGTTSQQRAEFLFCEERVWDTEENSGVLLYILIAERAIEIVVDRGILDKGKSRSTQGVRIQKELDEICMRAGETMGYGDPCKAISQAISALSKLLRSIPRLKGDIQNEINNDLRII